MSFKALNAILIDICYNLVVNSCFFNISIVVFNSEKLSGTGTVMIQIT